MKLIWLQQFLTHQVYTGQSSNDEKQNFYRKFDFVKNWFEAIKSFELMKFDHLSTELSRSKFFDDISRWLKVNEKRSNRETEKSLKITCEKLLKSSNSKIFITKWWCNFLCLFTQVCDE